MDHKDNLLGVLYTISKWKRPIIILCLIAAVGSIAISLMLDDYYEATTVFYPASPDLAKPEQVFGVSSTTTHYYGTELEVDRLLTLSESSEVIDFLIKNFDLYKHYDIDPESKRAAHKVKKQLKKLYNVKKTKYDAIELSVEDVDRTVAASMVNVARDKINEIAQRPIKHSQEKLMETFTVSMKDKKNQLQILGDSLFNLRKKYRIYNTEAQSESLSSLVAEAESKLARNKAKLQLLEKSPTIKRDTLVYLKANVSGLEQELSSLQATLKLFTEGQAMVEVIQQQHEEASKQLSFNLESFNQLQSAYNSNVAALFIMEDGGVPDIKSRPKRSIIVISAVLITFLFSVIGVLILETYKNVDWQEIINAK